MSDTPVSPGGGSHQSLFIDMASDKCQREKRNTINGDDLLRAIATLGSEVYIERVKVYLARYREMEGDTKGSAKGGDSSARMDAMGGQSVPNAQLSYQGSFNPSVNYGSSQGLLITATDALNQDQRKRALEALERRFSAAESEILCNEQRHKKSRGEGDINVMTTSHLNSPSTTAPNKIGASFTPYRDASLKKNVKADDIYMKILQPVHENLLTIVEASDGGKEIVRKVQHHLLSGGDVAQKYLQGFGRKYGHGYIRLDCCVQGQSRMDDRSRALQSLSKRSKKHMSMKELKMYGSHNLPLELLKYDIFIPMHEMWKDYVMQMLKNVGKHKVADCLLAADLHGAILRVIGCKTDAFTGVVGIMIRETAEAFGIVTQENKFKVVPKRSSVFVLQASCWKITVHGESRITGRPAEGAMKK